MFGFHLVCISFPVVNEVLILALFSCKAGVDFGFKGSLQNAIG
jgi:hypothetical protein